MSSSTFKSASGDGYEMQMGRWSRRLADPFLDFAGFADGESVLDVGCGTGSLSRTIASKARIRAVTGIDYSPAYIEHARLHETDARIHYRIGDACLLSFDDASFDRVLSLLVLHFVPKPELAIAEMRRVARQGATVAAAVWDARGGFVANRIFFDTAAALDARGNARRARNYTRPLTRPGELAAAWRNAGLIDVFDTSLTIRMEYSCFDDFWTPNVGQDGPGAEYVGTLDIDARTKLQQAVRLAYLDGEEDGPRSYAATAWAVKGRAP